MSAEHDPLEQETFEQAVIRLSVERAVIFDERITDAAARLIASQLHSGQASAMYSLASCGAIDRAGLEHEIVIDLTAPDVEDDEVILSHLVHRYAREQGERGPVEGWSELTRDKRLAEMIGQLAIEAGDD